MSNPNIIIGCGGSGLEIIHRLNRKLVHDPFWSRQLSQDIYYIGLDTNAKDLKDLRHNLEVESRSITPAYVKTFQTSADYQMLPPVVHRDLVEPFGGGANSIGLERLKEHWWFDAEGNPASAPRVFPLYKGAGQQPAVSFFLTWKSLEKIGNLVGDLVREIILRRSIPGVERPPLHHLNVILAAGLAGGTGRGAWKLVAAKVKDAINKEIGEQNQAVNPICFFMDATCYPDRFENESYENKMRANSLTGFSELSTWIGHERDPDFSYRLPSLSNPESEDSDLIQLKQVTGGGPMFSAMLAFGRNEMAVIDETDDGFEMVASSIYGLITQSVIQSVQINKSGYPFWGIGSSVFEVPIEELKHYFEEDARGSVCRRLIDSNDNEIESEAEDFLSHHGWALSATELTNDDLKGVSERFLLGRFRYHYEELLAENFNNLRDVLEEDDLDGARQMVEAFDEREIAEGPVREALRLAIASCFPDASPVDAIKDKALKDDSSILHLYDSLKAAGDFIDQVCYRIQKGIERLETNGIGELDKDIDPKEEIELSKGLEYMIVGRKFNKVEIEQILYEARVALIYRSMPLLLRCLWAEYEALSDALKPIEDQIENTVKVLGHLARDFENRARAREEEGGLFTSEQTSERSIANSSERFQIRKLRPLAPSEEQYRDAIEINELAGLLREHILALVESPIAANRAERRRLEREVESMVQREVGIGPRLLDQFTIENTIAGLREHWLEYFDKIRNNPSKFNEVAGKFHQFFGVRVRKDSRGTVEFDDDYTDRGFLCRMGSALVTVCRPYWMAQEVADRDASNVLLFIPKVIPDNEQNEFEDTIGANVGRELNVDLKVFGMQKRAADTETIVDGNPYMMLAYSDAAVLSLDAINSLSYWRANPPLQKMMDMAEDPSGESMFNTLGDDLGLGYPDPSYLKNPAYHNRRWKPWVRGQMAEVKRRDRAVDALLYAFLTPSDTVATKLAERNWQHPVLKVGNQQWISFTRRPFERFNVNTGAEVKNFPDWDSGDKMQQSIRRALDIFNQEAAGGDEDVARAIKWRAGLLVERELFWNEVAPSLGFVPGTVEFREIWQETRNFCEQQYEKSMDEADKKVWRMLGERAGLCASSGTL